MSQDLTRFRGQADTYMDEVHARRDAVAADIAVLITSSHPYYCGVASTIMANEGSAFALATQNCATGYYSFGHELGHLQGARHNPENDPASTPFPYGHGYRDPPAGWRTVMAYDTNPHCCTRIPYWSNPNVSA